MTTDIQIPSAEVLQKTKIITLKLRNILNLMLKKVMIFENL